MEDSADGAGRWWESGLLARWIGVNAAAGVVVVVGGVALELLASATTRELASDHRWVAVVLVAVIGAVGQPRDGNPAACYALFDDVTRELTYVRVPYDIAGAQRKIRNAGLPPFLSARLARGM